VELVFAVLTGHAWQAFVGWMQNAIANEALFDSFNLFVNIVFPKEHCRDDITVSELQEIFDGEDPLVLLSLCNL
jgi:hypothetical protein